MFKRNSHRISILVAILLVLSLVVSTIPKTALAQTASKTFDLIEVTDFHGYLQNPSKLSDGSDILQQRAAVMAKQIKDIKLANPNTIILSGGDMFQGTPLSNVLKGQPVIAMMNSIGFDAMALGNHEYDWGIDAIINTQTATLKNSSIPVLAANVFDKTTNKPISYVKPYIMLQIDGVKIAIIGIIDHREFPYIIMPAFIHNVDFKDPVPIVNTLASQLRKNGAQIIVVLAHMGAFYDKKSHAATGNLIDFANQVVGVDAIFGGHTHTIVTTKVHGIPVGVAGSYGRGYIELKLTLNPNGKVFSDSMRYHKTAKLYNVTSPIGDPDVQAIVDKANRVVGAKFHEVIGTATINLTRYQSAHPYGDSVLGNWAAEVTRKAVGADFGFANNGGLRIDISKGNITVGDIYQLMPFDNTLVTMKMTGAQIKTILEQAVMDNGRGIQIAGLSFSYDHSKPSMQRVFEIKKSNRLSLDMNTLYLVATNNFIGTGGDGFKEFANPTIARTYMDSHKLVRDAFIDAVKAQTNIVSTIDYRIKSSRMP
jgi:2',3'-cyclic-nucleotide 2'-phosphodiesterase/3'-nucleotidase